MARVLVVEDSRTQALLIKVLLEEVPHEVDVATDGVEALKMIAQAAPDIVLTDLEMPNMNGLRLVEEIRENYSRIPVVLMTAHGSEKIAAVALSKGAASYIPKAHLHDDVVPTLKRLLDLTSVRRQHAKAFERLAKFELHFVIDNDPSYITPIIGYLSEILELQQLHDPTDRMRISVALQEACLNAIYHGNLDVSSDLRQEDESVFYDMVRKRREQPPYQFRRMRLDVNITPDEAMYTVRDEGKGFNPSTVPDPNDETNLDRIGGRGLLLIRTFMDTVSHNATGNEITMVKRHRR